jgi:3-oxoacyl-[acyl-carrier-protein] synthase III
MQYAHIIGWGKYLPQRVLTNHDLSQIVDTSDEWITTRTGIRERHIAAAGETTATLAFQAAVRALDVAGVQASDVDLIIVATSTPAAVFPSTASLVQDYLGAWRAGAFDLSAACSGFVYALSMGGNAIAAGSSRIALVIGAETMSRVLDWKDRGTCILFGDGAGAVVLKGSSIPGGLLASSLRSDGSGGDLLRLPAVYTSPVPGIEPLFSANGKSKNTISMNGRQIFRFATHVIADVVRDVLEEAELTTDDVALIVPHQANARIVEAAAKRLKIPAERFFLNLDMAGNTSAASIPIALCDAVEAGLLKPNDNVVFVGFGGGLTWAASVLKWEVTPPAISVSARRWRRAGYVVARGRSRLRQAVRRFVSFLAGSPTPEARMRDADHRDPPRRPPS